MPFGPGSFRAPLSLRSPDGDGFAPIHIPNACEDRPCGRFVSLSPPAPALLASLASVPPGSGPVMPPANRSGRSARPLDGSHEPEEVLASLKQWLRLLSFFAEGGGFVRTGRTNPRPTEKALWGRGGRMEQLEALTPLRAGGQALAKQKAR